MGEADDAAIDRILEAAVRLIISAEPGQWRKALRGWGGLPNSHQEALILCEHADLIEVQSTGDEQSDVHYKLLVKGEAVRHDPLLILAALRDDHPSFVADKAAIPDDIGTPVPTVDKAPQSTESIDDMVHSPDFRSMRWNGEIYSFTAKQAPVVKMLFEAWRQGTPDVGDVTLLAAVDHESPPATLRGLFRDHPAWGTMIVSGTSKGSHRLSGEPKNP